MSWCREYEGEWRKIIETVAAEEHRALLMVEKDTIQSMFLNGLAKHTIPFVFKGGTSLSKVYGLINRFSEDIDLSMDYKPAESEKKMAKVAIINIGDGLGLHLTNADIIQSRYNYNKYVFEYESLFTSVPLELIVETSFFQKAYPVEMRRVNSFVGKFCSTRDIVLPIPFEASKTEMYVQSLERTFIDKVFAICDYKLRNEQNRTSRHLYDIAKLLSHIEFTEAFGILVRDVRADRMLSKNHPSAHPEYNIHEILKDIIDNKFFESDFNDITRRLLYENMSYEEAIRLGIGIVADMDFF